MIFDGAFGGSGGRGDAIVTSELLPAILAADIGGRGGSALVPLLFLIILLLSNFGFSGICGGKFIE